MATAHIDLSEKKDSNDAAIDADFDLKIEENPSMLKSNLSNNVHIDKNTTHILVIGETGVGKSSLVKLLTGFSGIKTASDSNPCTKQTSFYKLSKHKNTIIYDTKGAQDCCKNYNNNPKLRLQSMESDDSKNDHDESKNQASAAQSINDVIRDKDNSILNEIGRDLQANNAKNLKIIWVIHNSNKETVRLQNQARFISKFNDVQINNQNDRYCQDNVWQYVLLIVCKPHKGESLTKSAQGAIAAAKSFGARRVKWIKNKNLIGYSNTDWFNNKQEKENNQELYELQTIKNHKKYHLYKSNEILRLINNCLTKCITQPYVMEWRTHKCLKCGLTGDSRFFDTLILWQQNFAKLRKFWKISQSFEHIW